MRRALLLLLSAGCNRALGLDPTTEIDAPPPDAGYVPPGCAGAHFVSTTDVTVMTMDQINDPTELDDHEIWFTLHQAGGPYQIASMTRLDATSAFDPPVPATFSTSGDDSDPALTYDGLHLLFTSNSRIFQVDRASPDSDWSAPSVVPGIDGENAGLGFDVSADGLAIYIASPDGVDTARRPEPTGTFGEVTTLAAGMAMQFPSISPDELELFFNPLNSGELHRLTRADRTTDFDVAREELVYQDAVDADITADSRTLIYLHGGQLQTAHRMCP